MMLSSVLALYLANRANCVNEFATTFLKLVTRSPEQSWINIQIVKYLNQSTLCQKNFHRLVVGDDENT